MNFLVIAMVTYMMSEMVFKLANKVCDTISKNKSFAKGYEAGILTAKNYVDESKYRLEQENGGAIIQFSIIKLKD